MSTDKEKGAKPSSDSALQIQPTNPAPANHVPDPMAAAAAALAKYRGERPQQSTFDALMAATRDQLHRPDLGAEILKGNTLPSAVWTTGPGIHDFTTVVDRRFADIARVMGVKLVNNKVARFHAWFVAGTDIMVMFPADPNDLSAFEIKRYDSGTIHANLSNMLIAQGVAVESGYKEFRPVTMIPEGSKLWPGLSIDYSGAIKPLDRKVAVKEKEEEEGEEAE
ncbi:MAG: hypothetical protein K0R39_3421 [Symbiobacteriaceae bacterium]|jgi:hypothetical protein|nr:hypothetical protein [Symbiobacteriaceae bacterium]